MRNRDYRDLLATVFLAVLSGIGASLLFGLVALLLAAPAAAEDGAAPAHSGALHVRTASGRVIRHAPRLATEVDIRVTGMLVRASVRQRFRNPTPEWVEAVYVFPLPEDAAVDHLRMRFGGRVIEGEIQEKARARRTYEQARSAGQRASLVEQERPNLFTTAVANLPPGEEITVELEYQQVVQYRAGQFSLRFPMVVGPRYIPGTPLHTLTDGFDGQGWARATDQVPDAARITPPLIDQGDPRRNPVRLNLELRPGIALAEVRSLYHAIDATALPDGGRALRLAAGEVAADRDFVLEWRLAGGAEPGAALFQETWQDRHYGLLMLTPPAIAAGDRPAPPRELVLVVDTSGSMHGASIEQARAALHLALRELRPQDRFNIIRFNDGMHALYPGAVDASPRHLAAARRYVDGLEADGGTEMEPAMRYALQQRDDGNGRLRQVVFLTDGDIGNEEALFKTIERHLGASRLFPVAIGSAPNSYFMTRAAEFGRGSYTYIGDLAEVEQKMARLFERLAAPVLTDVRVSWQGGGETRQAPRAVPDLYAGEPLLLAVQATAPLAAVRVEGMLGDRAWSHEVRLGGGAADGAQASGIHVLWARRMIADWMARRTLGEDAERVRSEVLGLALTHHLVSPYSSLVAVDRTPVRPQDEALHSKPVPTHLPHGWSQAHVIGSLPQTATPALLHVMLGLLLSAAAWLGLRRGRA